MSVSTPEQQREETRYNNIFPFFFRLYDLDISIVIHTHAHRPTPVTHWKCVINFEFQLDKRLK